MLLFIFLILFFHKFLLFLPEGEIKGIYERSLSFIISIYSVIKIYPQTNIIWVVLNLN